jgi:serine O-acetyltransferase
MWRHRFGTFARDWTNIRWYVLALYKVADRLNRSGRSQLARGVALLNRVLTGVEIRPGAAIGPRLSIEHGHGIVITSTARIGADCLLLQQVTLGQVRYGELLSGPVLGDRVKVFAGAKILGDIHIGDDAVIGANAVVLEDVAPGDTVGGIPARSLKNRGAADQ